MKLNPEQLVVASFETGVAEPLASIDKTNLPTPATDCDWCPAETEACTADLC